MVCFKGYEDIGQAIMDKAKETITQFLLVEWVNAKTIQDGFSAIHFASFRGNIALIELLI